ncbi:hypothetical protein ABL78_3403 [Leptomonas seymouri]|uniref:PUM-HD domain-containing protein n=1 Tax=Leptomonas seymouri TaxID=5684 RepID=A0A0N1PEQ4_LEPSE|nr:hypothetical protein ABL78_3403 [Leptomonas seymouri]|eukprot:KPI87525.1 hypothetical protein ABL78_3403 [Leptomonas seymouri]
MFAETESEELLHLLSQVRLVADEEARTDEQQQQQQQRSQPLNEASGGPESPMHGYSKIVFSPTCAGRYTASSTATVGWTVHDSSHVGGSEDDEPTAGRTPATGVKVLHQQGGGSGMQRLDTYSTNSDVFDEGLHNALQQPKQLFFMETQKRDALQWCQPGREQQGSSHSPFMQSGVDGVGARSTVATADRSLRPTIESISSVVEEESGCLSLAFPRTVSPDKVASLESAGVMSTVLSVYTRSLTQEVLAGGQGGSDGAAHVDGLSRIAAELESATGEEDGDKNNRDGETGDKRSGGGGDAGHDTMRAALTDLWMPARGMSGSPHALCDNPASSLYTYSQQQQQQQAAPANALHCAAPPPSSSPLFAEAATRASYHADPAVARSNTGGGSAVSTPLGMMHTAMGRTQQQQASPPAPTAAEAAVANFFRMSGAGPEENGGARNCVNNGSSSASGNEAAWRLSVEAELNELQHSAHAGDAAMGASNANNSNVYKYSTPTIAVSPLAATSTTPYHQLLSQMRYSPQQQGTAGGGARANTPLDRRACATAQPNVSLMQPTESNASRVSGGTSRYTANVNRASPFTGAMEAVRSHSKSVLHNPGWQPASPSPAEAAALWDRMSPYERAAAAAATTAHCTSLFRTPDTVAKPVTLSSIAAHLQGGEVSPPEELTYFPSPLQPLQNQAMHAQKQKQQQQQQPRHPSPPVFTTAAASPSSALRRPGGSANSLLPAMQQPQQQMMISPSTTPAGSVPPRGWAKQQQQQQQQQSSVYAHTATPRSMASSVTAPARAGRPPQQFHSPSALHGSSPEEATATAHSNSSPPSCSLRPSPQMRASDGSSPALRRYVISTPNTRSNTAGGANGASNASYNSNGTNSASKRSCGGGSPLGQYGNGSSGSPVGAAAREARPRVQLSHITGVTGTSLRSPLNQGSPHYHPMHGPSSSSPSAHTATSSSGGGGSSPLYHSSKHGTNTAGAAAASAASCNAASGVNAASATSVPPAAVSALIERLQAVAPAVLSGSPTATAAAAAAVAGTGEAASGASAEAENFAAFSQMNLSASNTAGVPDVASASVILSMSHDQHGCRLLQAVLDAECESGDSTEDTEEAAIRSTKGSADSLAGSGSNSTSSAEERRRRRRAKAFYRSTAVQVILRAIEPRLNAVMADGYGNFLLQKVFDMAPDAERQRLLRLPSLQHHLCEVACSPHGTFAVQRLVETVRNTEEERLVFVALERDLLRLLTNANGGHVLMKVMECIRRQYAALTTSPSENAASTLRGGPHSPSLRSLLQDRVDALFTAMQQNLLFVCQHKQGCCIVQKCLDFLNTCSGLSPTTVTAATATRSRKEGDDKDTAAQTQKQSMDYFERMSALLLPHAHGLSVNPFGNYVVTRLVDVCYARGTTNTIDAIATVMQSDLIRMCTNKFASNVMEHILRHCSERRIRSICQALMTKSNTSVMPPAMLSSSASAAQQVASISPAVARLPLATVVMDSYGNYVVQTLLTVAPVDELVSTTSAEGGMLPVLQQLLPLLSSRNFGRKLETKTELALLRVEQHQFQHQHP